MTKEEMERWPMERERGDEAGSSRLVSSEAAIHQSVSWTEASRREPRAFCVKMTGSRRSYRKSEKMVLWL